jgi:glutathione S-transferase
MQLYHHPFCPLSRFIRLALSEYGVSPELILETVSERRAEFLQLNPSGGLPVLVDAGIYPVAGVFTIPDYLEETIGVSAPSLRLLPDHTIARAEVRRLLEWFNLSFYTDVSAPFKREMIDKRFLTSTKGGGAPNMTVLRAARANLKPHLRYIGWLMSRRSWLAGETLSFADLAAGAHLSILDYFGDVPWEEDEAAKLWYARLKSRPSFQALLVDRVIGMPAAAHYTNPDF